ncbi:hypothetical protein PWT90_08568 [Aphanocladium album]|nr:hypothetical protein PWT90_08568 [Aphanocladium album]
MATFHLFPLLPLELRLRIWEAAVRDTKTPGIQFFDPHEYGHFALAFKPMLQSTIMSDGEDLTFKIGAHGSRSAYFIDSGLWNACTESYYVMRKVFSCGASSGSLSGRTQIAAQLTTTLSFQTLAFEPRLLTWLPFHDLIATTLEAFELHIVRSIYLKIFRDQRPALISKVTHFAFEYNPAFVLLRARRAPFYRRMRDLMMLFEENTTIYFIDHKLRRRNCLRAADTVAAGGKSFAANGGRYVEVENEDDWEYGSNYLLYGCPSLEFVQQIRELIQEHQHERRDDGWDIEPSARLAVLVWEPSQQ